MFSGLIAKLAPYKLLFSIGILAAIAGGVLWYGHSQKEAGRKEVKDDWNAAVERGKAEVQRLKNEAGKITTVTEVQTVERVKIIREKGDEIIKRVEVFVPVKSDPKLNYVDGGFRVYHDAAVENRVPDTAEIPHAAPTTLTEIAATAAENYKRANVCFATVEAWQAWATKQCKLNDNGCPPNG